MSDPNSARELLADRIRLIVSHRIEREMRMFGGVSFMIAGRMAVAAGRGGDLLVRTDHANYDDHLARGAAPASMGTDRTMGKGWLSIPADRLVDDDELEYWVSVGTASGDRG